MVSPGLAGGFCSLPRAQQSIHTNAGVAPLPGATPSCAHPESRSQSLLLLRWPGGSTCARSSLRPGLCAPQLPAGPPAPSSKTKRAPGGAKHDCNLGGRVGEAGYLCQCRSPKKTKTKQEWSIDALGTKFKLDFCLGPEVMGPNSPVSNPCQGCSDPTPTLANASLLAAESRSLVALAFSAPSSGWTGLLVTSPPPNQPALFGSTYYS